jgi:two-component system response regulator
MITSHKYIMLVEDSADDEELTVRALRAANVANQLQICRDGAEALDFLFARGEHSGRNPEHLPAVVLLDLKLPKLDGIDVLRALRADERTRKLPVVVLTSSREQQDVLASYELGSNGYVRKPVSFAEFSAAVGQLGLYWALLNEPPPLAARGG